MKTDIKLSDLKLPDDLKKLSDKQCRSLCKDIRRILIRTVGKNGGHLSSNLGTVELTVALHRVFDSPKDKIVWDVGHQAYTHKLLTGRADRFGTLRKENGLSGFSRPSESEHDIFVSGHSSNSISAACGIAKGMKLSGDDHHVIAVIGDGAFTGGLAYEGLNNAGKNMDNLIVILNDNEMSISKNVGAFAKYLSSIRGQRKYIMTKNKVEKILDNTPVVGKPIAGLMMNTKDTIRYLLYRYGGFDSSTMFENMGFVYLGPVDGHDIHAMSEYMEAAKSVRRPVLIHVMTKKGKGYSPAEQNPGAFHGLSPDALPNSDPEVITDNCFSSVFGRELAGLATYDSHICAITAAMKYGTGLNHFACEHPDRFFDVGIAEGHAVTFASGLSTQGRIPVFAVYSSFLQRSYDQLIHDAAIAKNHIVLGIDRAGFVGEDGETHQGLFDVAMLSSVPNVTIYSPATYAELRRALSDAIYETEGIACVRYPKGAESKTVSADDSGMVYLKVPKKRKKRLAVSYGRAGAELYAAVTENGIKCDVLRPLKIFPIDKEITDICKEYSEIFIFEEGMRSGGFAEHLTSELYSDGWKGTVHITACSGFEAQATVARQLEKNGLDRDSIARRLTDAS